MLLLKAVDWFLFGTHALLILFNLTGWAFARTRKAHLVTLGLTAFSWFALGAFCGWGYCFCTDYHFRIRKELDHNDPETSYVQLLLRVLFGVRLTRPQSDLLAFSVFAGILFATAITWWRAWRTKPAAPDA